MFYIRTRFSPNVEFAGKAIVLCYAVGLVLSLLRI